jgi:hypothetical protein
METAVALNLPLEKLVTLVFYFSVIVYVVFTVIIRYHWKAYSVDEKVTRITLVLYYVTTIPLMLLLGFLTLII